MKKALISGISGQDGSYLAEQLLEKNYVVHGMVPRTAFFNSGRKEHLLRKDSSFSRERFFLHHADLTDSVHLNRLLESIQPDEIYNLGSPSHFDRVFDIPERPAEMDGTGTRRLLDAIKDTGLERHTRYFQASTSELYGIVQKVSQKETPPFYPRSPYSAARLYAYWIVVNYRKAYGLHASNGILFNHESPRREETFVTRKITKAAARIKAGQQSLVVLGNLDSRRDWGYAPEYTDAMWRILQQPEPGDYICATDEAHSVREFTTLAFAQLGMNLEFFGQGLEEVGIDTETGEIRVRIDPKHYRFTEADLHIGNHSKAKVPPGWEPSTKFADLVQIMVEADWAAIESSAFMPA
jgi:GDPmannose 4,6-dehydratase